MRSASDIHVLGLDAGGTKTVCLLANGEGVILSRARRGGANLQASGELEVEKVLHDVMEDALAGTDVMPDAICLGIAGADRSGDAEVVRGIMRRIGAKARVLVVNDALVALEAGAPGQPGVVIISGTGRSRTAETRPEKRHGPVAGVTCSATRAAATGSDGRRCVRYFARRTSGDRARL